MRRKHAIALCALGLVLLIQSPGRAEGPDVILGELVGPRVYAKHNDVVAITVGTTSCNAGNRVLNWLQLPDNRHPIITMNMYVFWTDA